jgi:hypothetical protein
MNIFLYYLTLIVSTLVLFTLAAVVLGPLKLLEKQQARWRDAIAITVFMISPLGAYSCLAYFDIYPQRIFEKRDIATENITDMMLIADQKALSISRGFEDPENMTIAQLRILIGEVKDYTEKVREISEVQTKKIAELKSTAEIETKKAEEAQKLAQTIKSLTNEQLDAVKFLITSDANTESRKAFIYGAIISFPIGIISSIVASALWERLGRRREILVEQIGRTLGNTEK